MVTSQWKVLCIQVGKTPYNAFPPSVLTCTNSHTFYSSTLLAVLPILVSFPASFDQASVFCSISFQVPPVPFVNILYFFVTFAFLSHLLPGICASDILFFIVTRHLPCKLHLIHILSRLLPLQLFGSYLIYYSRSVHKYLRFLVEIDRIKLLKQQKKEDDKRQKTAVVGDMRPLVDTLPTLELLMKEVSKVHQTKDE